MSALYTLFGTLIALGVLVTIHEYGHFWVARRCGVRVLRFSVGFGKPLLRWHDRHSTEFVVAAIPLGGYVRMLDAREAEVPEAQREACFNHKPVLQRIAIVAAGPLANFALAVLFFWLLAMLGSQQLRPVIGAVSADSLAERGGLRAGDEIIAIDGTPTPGWQAVNLQLVRRLGETGVLEVQLQAAGNSQPVTRQLQLEGWQRDVDQPEPLRALGIQPWRPKTLPRVATLDPQGPAQAAGVQLGDRLLALDDQPLDDWQQVVDWVREHPGQAQTLLLERDGLRLQLGIRLAERNGSGYLGVGVQAAEWPPQMLRELRFGPLEAVPEGLRKTWSMTMLTLDSLGKMLFGELSVKNLSGPITIAKVAGASAQSGVADFLGFLAYLSISLGVLNLLPVPVLDGGHLLFYLIEWVRGRPVSEQVQGWAMQVGMGLLFAVMLLALINDLGRL